MSNYLLMLENHLTRAQSRVIADLQMAAAEAGVNLFLSGAAMRDAVAGSAVRDLEFVVEDNAAELVRRVEMAGGATVLHSDDKLLSVDLLHSSGVRARVDTARQELYPKPGVARIIRAGIHEHLRSRDFAVNSIALSLSRNSRGLLLDPNNGVSDVQRRELRAISNSTFYDRPIRLLKAIRMKVTLGFSIEEKTRQQYQNARSAAVEDSINPVDLLDELRRTAHESHPEEVLQAWAAEGLLARKLPMLAGGKLNSGGFAKLNKARQVIPFDTGITVDEPALFFFTLTEKLTPRERSDLIAATGMTRDLIDSWHKLGVRAARLERELAAAEVQKPSQVYRILSRARAEAALFLLIKGAHRSVNDRIRNYFNRYLPVAQEVSDDQVSETGVTPGSAKFDRIKAELIGKRLDARPKRAEAAAGTAAASGGSGSTSRAV